MVTIIFRHPASTKHWLSVAIVMITLIILKLLRHNFYQQSEFLIMIMEIICLISIVRYLQKILDCIPLMNEVNIIANSSASEEQMIRFNNPNITKIHFDYNIPNYLVYLMKKLSTLLL